MEELSANQLEKRSGWLRILFIGVPIIIALVALYFLLYQPGTRIITYYGTQPIEDYVVQQFYYDGADDEDDEDEYYVRLYYQGETYEVEIDYKAYERKDLSDRSLYYNKWNSEVFMGNGLIFFRNFYFAGVTVVVLIILAVVAVKPRKK